MKVAKMDIHDRVLLGAAAVLTVGMWYIRFCWPFS